VLLDRISNIGILHTHRDEPIFDDMLMLRMNISRGMNTFNGMLCLA
jgi:hypothetical protein